MLLCEVPWAARRSYQSILKEISPGISLEGMMLKLKLQYFWPPHAKSLFLGRKVLTNLDSIFKSRDITSPTKVHLVKAMVFPAVMYGCESRTVKKAER